MCIDHLLDDGQCWRDVVIGDDAGRAAAVCDHTGASSAKCFRVESTWAAGLVDAVVTGIHENLNAVLIAGEIIAAGMARCDMHCEITGCRGTAIVVDNVLNNGDRRSLIAVRDRTRLRLANGNRACAISGIRGRVTGDRRFTNRIGARIQSYGSTGG